MKKKIKLWHSHFKYLVGNPPQVSYREIAILNDHGCSTRLNIKTGAYTIYKLMKAIQSIHKVEKHVD